MKGFDLPEITEFGLFSEVFGNLLARQLGIDTPSPCLVYLSPIFIEAANLILEKQGLTLRSGIASGCEYFSGGYTNVVPQLLSDEEFKQAAKVYAFDLLVQNPDRTAQRPNCATFAGRVKVFDFETAFSFVRLIGSKSAPWEVSKHGLGSQHLFHSELARRKLEVDWMPFVSEVKKLNADILDQMIAGLPLDWRLHEATVCAHLLDVINRTHRFQLELRRSLL